MAHLFRFADPVILYILLPLVALVAVLVWLRRTKVRYRYPLASLAAKQGFASYHPHKKIFFCMRLITLFILALLIARPQSVDSRSKITVEGIDIILVLDVSGSMSMPHHANDERSRIAVAKEEALHFIEQRTNDALGVVIFGNDAASRCPLTVDKGMLREIINEIDIGSIDHEGTVLATAMVTAANRLKSSTARSKIMILLTDGEPSENDSDPALAITIAKQLGIKVYTIGIGDNQEIMVSHPFYGMVPFKTTLNRSLLTKIAHETGGQFFEAKSAEDMRAIYDTINRLETTKIEAPLFTRYYELFMPWAIGLLVLMAIESLLKALVWFGLS